MGLKPQQKKGSGFVNLNKVIGANQNNQLGQTVAQGINKGAQQVQQGLGQATSQFQQQADANNLASIGNQQARSAALQNIMGGQTAISDDQAKQFGTFRAGQYAGPQELDASRTAQIGAKAREVEGFGKALQSGGDKSRVLQAFAGKGNYTAGQQGLDSLLLGKGPNAGQLNQARRQSAGLTNQLGSAQDAAQQLAQLRQGQAAEFGKQTNQQIGDQQTGINTNVADNVVKYKQQQIDDYNKSLQNLQDRNVSGNAQLKDLVGQNLFGIDPKGYLDKGFEATKENTASELQRRQLEALAKIGGQGADTFNFSKDIYDPNKSLVFNKQKLLDDVAVKRMDYRKAISQDPNEFKINQGANMGKGIPNLEQALAQNQAYAAKLDPNSEQGQLQARINQAMSANLEKIRQQQQYYDKFK